MKATNERALRESMDRRECASDGDYEAAIAARIKSVDAPNEHVGLQLLSAEECPEEDPNLQDPASGWSKHAPNAGQK